MFPEADMEAFSRLRSDQFTQSLRTAVRWVAEVGVEPRPSPSSKQSRGQWYPHQSNTCTKRARRTFPDGSLPKDRLEAVAGLQFGAGKGAARGTNKERRGVLQPRGTTRRSLVW